MPLQKYETERIAFPVRNRNLLQVMPRPNLPPYLTTVTGKKRCSACGIEFPKDCKPSVSKAFAEHVRKVHKPKAEDK
jgi:hypothetical protein